MPGFSFPQKLNDARSRNYCPVTRKIGACGGGSGTTVPVSGVEPTSGCETLHSNCVAERPVASTVRVCPFKGMPAELVKVEIVTLVPGVKLFVAVKVTTLAWIENDVIVVGRLQTPVHAPDGATMLVINWSG